ncbi:hypothetical protein CapIbe_012771 [Capra ibex]
MECSPCPQSQWCPACSHGPLGPLLPQYDISNGGQPGGEGEYEVQEGFGWTNGVALMLLDRYGDRLSSGAQTTFLAPYCLAAALLLSLLPQ